jgi:hypothetical protein
MLAFVGIGLTELIVLFVLAGAAVGIVLLVMLVARGSAPLSMNPNLTPCPDCGRGISKLAQTCPHCGRPLHLK